ncbi:MAG: ABC transporter permease [Candidatus Acidiferrales bacterium]
MNTRQIAVVFRKELTDTLRDRRTLINSVLIPLLLTPLIFIGVTLVAVLVVRSAVRSNPAVMILGEENAPELAQRLRKNERIRIVAPGDDYAQRINDRKLRAAVEFPPDFERNLREHPGHTQTVKLYWFEGEVRSRDSMRRVEREIDAYAKDVVKQRLEGRQLSASLLEPFKFEQQNVAPAEKVTGNILGFILPYFVIILCLTGAMHPAMDLTAGEKERGTMETIIASPVNRLELVIGKFLLVLVVSAVTTILAIATFVLSALGAARLLPMFDLNFVIAVSGKAAAAVFFLVLPLAVLFAAALMAVSLFARNFREAQTYIGPLMFVVILPAMGSFIPGVQLDTRFALVPILNISLAAKEVFGGTYQWPLLSLIFLSTCVYAAAALYYAVRQFHREDVLFRS